MTRYYTGCCLKIRSLGMYIKFSTLQQYGIVAVSNETSYTIFWGVFFGGGGGNHLCILYCTVQYTEVDSLYGVLNITTPVRFHIKYRPFNIQYFGPKTNQFYKASRESSTNILYNSFSLIKKHVLTYFYSNILE